mgnify:CR=1 FL=1
MSSTTFHHICDVSDMYATQKHSADVGKMVTFCHRFAALGTMVRNAGQLPEPFWLGAACGGGSCGTAPCAART